MEEDLTMDPIHHVPRGGQAGFSMVEMLMTSLILAVGLLGLCMLQTMSLRAGRGSTSLNTAVKVGEGVMDIVETQGRLSWLNITSTGGQGLAVPTSTQNYIINLKVGSGLTTPLTYNVHGNPTDATSADPTISGTIFTVNVIHLDEIGVAAGTGFLGDWQVVVTFADTITGTGVANTRTVTLVRRIAHG
jgi:prepilin-type N-terminal cleavage/methylation domain-containing protein